VWPQEINLGFPAKKIEKPLIVEPERRRTYNALVALTTIWHLLFFPTSIASFFLGCMALQVPRDYLYGTGMFIVGLFSLPIVLWKSSHAPWKYFALGKDKQALSLALAPVATFTLIAIGAAVICGIWFSWKQRHLI
jgi:hypothetical protein